MGFLDSRLRRSDVFRGHNAISHLKNRILIQSQGGIKLQPAGILTYFEELKREFNTGFGPKDIFEIASNLMGAIARHFIVKVETKRNRQLTPDSRRPLSPLSHRPAMASDTVFSIPSAPAKRLTPPDPDAIVFSDFP